MKKYPVLLLCVCLLAVVSTAGAGEFVPAGDNGIPDRYLVLLSDLPGPEAAKRHLPPVAEQAREVLASLPGERPLRIYQHAVRGFLVELPEAAARQLAKHPRVLRVEQDQTIYVQAPECPDVSFEPASSFPSSPQWVPCLINATSCKENWALDRIDQAQLPLDSLFYFDANNVGDGTHIYFLDTGIDSQHTEFKDANGMSRVGTSVNFAGNVNGDSDHEHVNPSNFYDAHGHGTHVSAIAAGLRYGVAKDATVHAVRVGNNEAQTTTSIVAQGVDWIAQNHVKPAVVNISINFEVSRKTPSELNFMEQAFQNLISWYGVAVVNSAGNFNQDANNFSPTRVADIFVVGATDNIDSRWGYGNPGDPCYLRQDEYSQCGSNYGWSVDLFAPGYAVVSAWTNTSTRTGACRQTGTSLAAPLAAGVAATYLETHPTALPSEVAQALISNATAGVLNPSGLGAGSPNLMLRTLP